MTKYIAARSFVTRTSDGTLVTVTKGVTRVDETHELYRRFPTSWRREGVQEPDVEQATAAPGEKRGQKP